MKSIPQEPFEPRSGLVRWIERRMPVFSILDHMNRFPTPKNLNWMWVFGAVLAVFLVLQIITGIVLAMHYTSHVDQAFSSVEHIMRNVNSGWLIRYAHANGASFFFAAVYLHIFRGLYYGSYKEPRELLWLVGMVIYIVMMATAFMGYVLPWGQMSFWGATVITNLFSAVPVIGDEIVTWLWGGFSVDNPTLGRFYALHYLLPFVLVALVGAHIWALHTVGNSNPAGVDVRPAEAAKDTVPFSPFYTVKDLYAVVLVLVVFVVFVFFMPNYLGHPDNYIEADPLKTPEHIVPEWYFLPFYAILRSIPDKLLGVMAMFGSLGLLVLVPWLDTSRVRSARYRPIYRWWFWLLALDFLVLMYIGAKPAEGVFLIVGRIATAYWFIHFLLVMPIVGLVETPREPPKSIDADFRTTHARRAPTGKAE